MKVVIYTVSSTMKIIYTQFLTLSTWGIWNSLRLLSEKKQTGKHDLEKQRRKGVMSNQNWDLIWLQSLLFPFELVNLQEIMFLHVFVSLTYLPPSSLSKERASKWLCSSYLIVALVICVVTCLGIYFWKAPCHWVMFWFMSLSC